MNMLTLLLTMMLLLSAALIMINTWLPNTQPHQEKLSPYECGFDPLISARLPFSLRFFLVAVLFLLFDLEIALLLPLPWAAQSNVPAATMVWTSLILALLTLGLMYEWTQGGLEWAE
uniref:NADH-ubiquinone oxidoreductase chain 3 n=1 Tax=Sphenodon punctatus TaxID=8508 RepID=A0A7U3N0L2_SPHPU|nr:NADH dehydrogenase subunit 3 [Sphenodon punctatus]